MSDERGGDPSRRDLVRGAAAAALTAAISAPLAAPAAAGQGAEGSTFSFDEVEAGSDERHHVAQGYDADVLIRWGDPVLADAPPFDPHAQTAVAQAGQFGFNNDNIAFFPIDGRADYGLLAVNHEYTARELMFPAPPSRLGAEQQAALDRRRTEVELMAVGASIIEVRRTAGRWSVVPGSRHARRITAATAVAIAGPAAGHPRMRTAADPTGTRVLGMLSTCAGSVTPWGTWLSCEENVNSFLWNKAAAAAGPDAKALARYGIPGEWNNWGALERRFDVGFEPNEPNRFGWVVEVDPYDPAAPPVKRTALGRFKHEAAGNGLSRDGRFVAYMGDDEYDECIYRYVSEARVNLADRAANRGLLDRGTLYVARFDAGNTGEWLPLVHGTGKLTAEHGFRDQGDVLIHARLAADAVGGTPMDRPEDIEPSPTTGRVYAMLTGNPRRSAEKVDVANPRPANRFGHIIEIVPDGGDHASDRFRWQILVKCGDPGDPKVGASFNTATSRNGWFGMPDNCAFDALGRLWVATDGNTQARTGRTDGLWAMETEGRLRATSRLFFRCPVGAELTGPCFTPDLETLFVSVQHPGEDSTFDAPSTRWPDFQPRMPPRSAVVAITRRGGGRIAV